MSFNPDTYTSSSNEVFNISIEDANGAFTFHPKFTYPIFGDSEQIFGFKDLKINLKFDSKTFLPLLDVSFSEKIDGVEIQSEVIDKLLEWLPEDTIIDDEKEWERKVLEERESNDYTGKGELITKYDIKNNTFNVHKLKFDHDLSIQLLKRLQIFVILFIEAGSYIDSSDKLWDLFLVTKQETKEIVGFATTYTYFNFTTSSEFDSWDYTKGYPNRKKISQFVVLPPYQAQNQGSKLYDTLVDYWTSDELVREITVEDPNEKFDDLRYRCDFERLYKNGFINNLPLDLSQYNVEWYKKQAQSFKLEFQQFRKVVEMGFIYDDKNLKIARLLIKKRLFDKNKEGLLEFEKSVRNDKLQNAYENIKTDYIRIIHSLNLDKEERAIKKQKI